MLLICTLYLLQKYDIQNVASAPNKMYQRYLPEKYFYYQFILG